MDTTGIIFELFGILIALIHIGLKLSNIATAIRETQDSSNREMDGQSQPNSHE